MPTAQSRSSRVRCIRQRPAGFTTCSRPKAAPAPLPPNGGAPRAPSRRLGERKSALQLPLQDRMLVGAQGAGFLADLGLDVLVELLERDETVAVGVGGPPQAIQHVVGEQAMPKLGELERELAGAGGRDDG